MARASRVARYGRGFSGFIRGPDAPQPSDVLLAFCDGFPRICKLGPASCDVNPVVTHSRVKDAVN